MDSELTTKGLLCVKTRWKMRELELTCEWRCSWKAGTFMGLFSPRQKKEILLARSERPRKENQN